MIDIGGLKRFNKISSPSLLCDIERARLLIKKSYTITFHVLPMNIFTLHEMRNKGILKNQG